MSLTVRHSTITGALPDSNALVDGPAWDADHTVSGDLPVNQLNGGAEAGPFTFWRGDGSWARPGQSNPWSVVHRKLRDGNSISINWFGDSLTFGYTPPSGQSSFNPPLALFQALQWLKYGGVSAVNNKGFVGDTAAQGYGRWSATTGGDIWIIMYGQNDANNGVTVATFYSQMVQWVELALTRGAAPLLLGTPHNQAAANDFNSRPYAEAMKEIAIRYNVPFVDIEEQIGWIPNRWNADGVHLIDASYNEVGYHLAALILGYDGVNLRRITPGTTLYCTDNAAAGTVLFSWAPGVTGQLAQIAANNDYLMVSGYFPQDVYPILTMANTNPGTTRQLNVLYAGGNFVGVLNFSNPGGDGTNVPYRTHHQCMRIPKGFRTMLLVNPDATNTTYWERLDFIAANDVIHQGPGDSNYTIPSGYTDVALGVVLTAPRTWTLPAASSVRANTPIIVRDAIAGLTSTNTITLTRAGSDTINGGTTFVMSQAWMVVTLISDGVSKWQASYQILLGSVAVYNTVPVANGGTNITTYTTGDTLYASATNTLSKRSVGSSGNVYQVSGGVPVWGAIDLTASGSISNILGAANGGTSNGFTAFSGPASSTKTFTLPNASATILTSNAAVTVAQGGTNGTSASGTLLDNITGFSSTGAISRTGAGAYAFRTLTAGASGLMSITNGDGVSGNPTVEFDQTSWSTYTPTITASSGTFTTVSGSGRYKKIGKTMHWAVQITVTTVGTASGNIVVPFPSSTTAQASINVAVNGINISTGSVYGTTIAAGATQAQIAVGTIANQTYFCGGSVEIQ